jgi:hypothetical protein
MELITYPNKPRTNDYRLNVPAFNQRDNATDLFQNGSRQCFLTTVAMLINYLKPQALKGYDEPESAYGHTLYKYGDTTDPQAQVNALLDFGIKAYFTNTASLDDVARQLYLGIPTPFGIFWHDSGHWLLATGRAPNGFYVNNPYGILHPDEGHSGYYTTEGFTDTFSWKLLKQVFTDLGNEAGYALMITAIDGKPTGVRDNL